MFFYASKKIVLLKKEKPMTISCRAEPTHAVAWLVFLSSAAVHWYFVAIFFNSFILLESIITNKNIIFKYFMLKSNK